MPPRLKLSAEEMAKLFRKLFKVPENRLYRSGWPDRERFSREFQMMGPGDSMAWKGEPSGIYWARHPGDLDPLILGERPMGRRMRPESFPPTQRGAILPEARRMRFPEEEWRKDFGNLGWRKLTNKLRKDYDIVEFPDIAIEEPQIAAGGRLDLSGDPIYQAVQLNPQSVVTQFEQRSRIAPYNTRNVYRILGVAPAIGSTAAGEMSLNEWHEQRKKRGKKK